MTRSMYESCARSEGMASLVFTNWIDALGTWVDVSASEMILEMQTKDSVDSLPPILSSVGGCYLQLNSWYL